MREYAERARKELRYFPHQFLEMLNDQHGYDIAVSLVSGSRASSGFYKLAEMNRLDLTVEALVVESRWHQLFEVEVLQAARKRLTEFGYAFPEDAWTQGAPKAPENQPTPRIPVVVDRIIRDGPLASALKSLHEHKCQRCGIQIVLPGNRQYADAHHIRPLGSPHDGPDENANLMCVCPNCHVLLDYAAVPIDLSILNSVSGHDIDPAHVEHHNARYMKGTTCSDPVGL